jgi:hypothetical protein
VGLIDDYAASLDPRVIAQVTAAIHTAASNVYTEGTTIAAGSNGQALPQATINVAAVSALFGTLGQFVVIINGAAVTINFTGTTGTSFTGCSGGTGTLATGQRVTLGNHTARAAFANQVAIGVVNLAPLILDAASFANLTAASTDATVNNAVASLWNEWASA